MKTKLLVALMLTSLLAGIVAVVPIRQVAAAGNATLSINPLTTTKGPGDVDSFFDVFLEVDTDTGIAGFDLKVAWDDDTLINLDEPSSWTNTSILLDTLWGAGNWEGVMHELGGGGGGGYYRVVALGFNTTSSTGIHSLISMHFQIKKGCNFLLHTHITIDRGAKLSDINYSPITVTTYNDRYFEITATVPDLEFEFYDPNPLKPIEYCKTFQIKVYVSHICANLKDYNLVIWYESQLMRLTSVDWTDGVLGGPSDGASYIELPTGTITVIDTGGITWSGLRGLLFTLTFHVEFDDREEHIWHANPLYDTIKGPITFIDATLSFEEGTIPMSGITMPIPLDIIINLIRGDVDCDGNVDVYDLRSIAAYYDQSSPIKYDLTRDGTIDIFDLVATATNFGYGT